MDIPLLDFPIQMCQQVPLRPSSAKNGLNDKQSDVPLKHQVELLIANVSL